MIEQTKWLDRTFTFDLQVGSFPAVLERLRGTPARAEDLVAHVPEAVLSARGNGWSVKEHIGHLHDLAALDEIRLAEFLSGATVLTAADMENRATASANHNARPTMDILREFRCERTALVDKLERLSPDQVVTTSRHPRLGRSIRLLDWVYFLAEHDDHHLVRARRILTQAPRTP